MRALTLPEEYVALEFDGDEEMEGWITIYGPGPGYVFPAAGGGAKLLFLEGRWILCSVKPGEQPDQAIP